MYNISQTDIPKMPVGEIVGRLSEAYAAVINSSSIRTMPSVMLWGPPGVGKSQAVREIAGKLETLTKKTVCVTDVRLLLFNPIDLRGIPTFNKDRTLAVWLKPKIFDMDESKDVVNILFLDEISSAPQSVQAAAYQITLDRVVGEHRLPDNCIVIAAGNRVTDQSVAFKMPKALANRLLHIEVENNFVSWKKWALDNGINDKVTGFLSFRNDLLLNTAAGPDELAFATPRSWEMVSNVLNYIEPDADKAYPLIAGLVGTGVAVEFGTWCQIYRDLPSVEDIFAGKNPGMPERPDCLYALSSAMVSYAKKHKDDTVLISNSIKFAAAMPPDFSVALIKDYLAIEQDYRKKLMALPAFRTWLSSTGSILNGAI